MTLPRHLLLVGFMAAGKTVVGRRLAGLLDYPFLDLDQEIEEAAAASVRQIFEREGEAGFRRRETEALDRCLNMEKGVVATGGGTFAQSENRESTPSVAPRGQTARQKNRGTARFIAMKKRKRPPTTQLSWCMWGRT